MSNLVQAVRQAGVVGAGGGGFPTHVKLAALADTVIANGAECEPLLHKDAHIMEEQAAALVAGVRLTMEAVGASVGIVGIKAKRKVAIAAVEAACAGTPVGVRLLGDYYPAGDEYDLVYSVTGRLVPSGGIPINVGVVVANIETLVNVAAAAEGHAVTEKVVTVAGAVRSPVTLRVPIGTSVREAIAAAGGATHPAPVVFLGGLMMGEMSESQDVPITKTTGGIVVLPRDHGLAQRRLLPVEKKRMVGKSACDQCRFCTEMCPRYLLGHAVEPHQVMRNLGFVATGQTLASLAADLCCGCGLCTLFACPEALFPKEACDDAKTELRRIGQQAPRNASLVVHGMRDGRQVPIHSLMKRLNVLAYDHPAPMQAAPLAPKEVVLPFKQSAGAPGRPVARASQPVAAGQVLTEVPEGALGVPVHAPFGAVVTALGEDHFVLRRAS